MAYRIVYGRNTGEWDVIWVQSIVCLCLLAMVVLTRFACPEIEDIFASEPSPAQAALAEGYAGGEGLRNCAVMYCAAVLEQAGYETEVFH